MVLHVITYILPSQNAASSASAGGKNSTTKSSALFCLLADLDGGQTGNSSVNANDPFASPTSAQAPASISQPSFANFENANIFTNTAGMLILFFKSSVKLIISLITPVYFLKCFIFKCFDCFPCTGLTCSRQQNIDFENKKKRCVI